MQKLHALREHYCIHLTFQDSFNSENGSTDVTYKKKGTSFGTGFLGRLLNILLECYSILICCHDN